MEFTKLDDRIYFIEGLNRGRYFYSNSLFIEDGKNLLIDTGTGLNEKIAKEKAIDIILISHGHEDHICGNSFYDNSLICSHSLDAPAVRSVNKLTELYNVVGTPVEEPMENFLRNVFNLTDSRVDMELNDGDIIETGKVTVKVIHTPGHSAGHCCFYIHESRIIFLGDIDLSRFGPWYGCLDSDINDFIKSAELIKELDYDTAVSGHKGISRDKKEIDCLLDQYIKAIHEREDKLLNLLNSEKNLEEIVNEKIIYKNFPEPVEMYEIMERTMMEKHLEKLLNENKIKKTDNGFVATSINA